MSDATEVIQPQEEQREDLEALLAKIADQLAELSSGEEMPSGYKSHGEAIDPSDVDFGSSAWLLQLIRVQAWINLMSDIAPAQAEKEPLVAAKLFFQGMGAIDPNQCVQETDGVLRLSFEGADAISQRLDTAIELQKQFQQWRETLSLKQATEEWREAWEELESQPTSSEPIKAKSETWRISDFSGKASRGQLNLNPSYQRGDVWPTRDAQKLVESIVRGIPLPSIILLRPASKNEQVKYEVVDGKQRLTSILRFIGHHPLAVSRVEEMDKKHPDAKLLEHFTRNYKKFKRLWKTRVGEALSDKREAEYYFPFRLAKMSPAFSGPLAKLAGKYYSEIIDEQIQVGDHQEYVGDVFEKSSDYKIPLIEYLDASPRQIHEVFHLYNRQGKHLNAEEIRNALFHDVDLVRLVLVASGDNPSPRELAPYFPQEHLGVLKRTSQYLTDYRFGTARYKRTKLLSWLFALLFQPSETNGELTIRSTAKQIDGLFASIRATKGTDIPHRLNDTKALVELVHAAERCMDAHSSADCWDKRFKDDDKGVKWQELQLVASLVAVFLIGVLRDPTELLAAHRAQLLKFTAAHPRPEKTQNKTQWAYIGEVALGIVSVVGLDEKSLEEELLKRYGVNCLPTLRAARKEYDEPRPGT